MYLVKRHSYLAFKNRCMPFLLPLHASRGTIVQAISRRTVMNHAG